MSENSPHNLKVDAWMPLEIGRYLQDTAHLDITKSGAYLHLLMHYWAHGPLPNDPAQLATICKMTPDAWSIAFASVSMFFKLGSDGLLHQTGADRRRAEWLDKRLKAHEKAVKAAQIRWQLHREKKGRNADAPSIAQAMPITYISTRAKDLPPLSPPQSGGVQNAPNAPSIPSAPSIAGAPSILGAPSIAKTPKENTKRKPPEGALRRPLELIDGNGHAREEVGGAVPSNLTAAPRRNGGRPGNAGVSPDTRFEPFRGEVFAFWKGQNCEHPNCPWSGKEDRALAALLASDPELSLGGFRKCLKHRAQSEINPAAMPGSWLRSVEQYTSGPLDKYGKPKSTRNRIV